MSHHVWCTRSDGEWSCANGCTHDRDEERASELARLRAQVADLQGRLKVAEEALRVVWEEASTGNPLGPRGHDALTAIRRSET